MQCHSLESSGSYLASDEILVNGMACKAIRAASTAAAQPNQQAPQSAQAPSASTESAPARQQAASQQPPAQPASPDRGTPRVFLQAASHGNTWNARRDQSMEMGKDFEKVCPSVRVTINQQAADYTVVLNHIEVGLLARDNQIEVADRNGDLLQTKEGGGIKGGVKNACVLIMSDWNKR
jgi:hypothetical protein